jgi:hypothetical protein
LTHNISVWKPVVVRLEGCVLFVLTHNFSVWKPVTERLEVKKRVGCGFIEGR